MTDINPTPSNAAAADRRPAFSPTFVLLTVLFCVCLIVANLMEIKTITIGPLTITAGVVVFPISYIINDCIVEIYGFARARFVIWLGFAMNLLATVLLQIGLWLPGDASWHGQEAMQLVFGAVPRILAASFIAFICGSMINAYVMSRMRIKSGSAKGFSLRAILSTVLGEGADSAIFFPIAFGGVLSWPTVLTLIVTQTLLKTLYEIMILPVTVRVVEKLRRTEGDFDLDSRISYKWWKMNEI